jgi:hypothetical protein
MPVLEEPVYDPATTDPSFPPPTKEQQDTVVVPDNWGGFFEETGHTSEEHGLDLTADIVFTELESTVQIRISELGYLPASDKPLEVVEMDEKVHPSTGSEVLKAVVVQPNADPLLTELSCVSALNCDSLAQGALSAPRPPRLLQPQWWSLTVTRMATR